MKKGQYILFLNTCSREAVEIGLAGAENKFYEKFAPKLDLSAEFLPHLGFFLKNHKTSFGDLIKIIVVSGPGGFTSTRVGVAVANALGFALSIPVVGVKGQDFSFAASGFKKLSGLKGSVRPVSPFYSAPPTITSPKKRIF